MGSRVGSRRSGHRPEPARSEQANRLARQGKERMRAGDHQGAASALDAAIALGGLRRDVGLMRARARWQLGDWAGMAEAYLALIEAFPEDLDPRWWAQVGLARRSVGDHAGAVEAYREALARDGTLGEWHRQVGRCNGLLGRWEVAQEAYDRALAADSGQAEWWAELAWVRRHLEDRDGAAEAEARAVTLGGSCGPWYVALGGAQRRIGAVEDAVRTYLQAVTFEPVEPSWLLGLGETFRAATRIRGDDAVSGLFDEVMAATGGRDALMQFGRRHLGRSDGLVGIRSRTIGQGESNVIMVHHTVEDSDGTARTFVQKVTVSPGEAIAACLVRDRYQFLPPGLTTPQVLDVVEAGAVTHVFLEYLPAPEGLAFAGLVRWPDLLAATVRLCAHLPDLVDGLAGLPTADVTADRLAAAVEQFERSPFLTSDDGWGAREVEGLGLIRSSIDDMAAMAAEATKVFSHNDLDTGNLIAVAGEGGGLASLVIYDWGCAGVNLAGADLHPLLYMADRLGDGCRTPEEVRSHLFADYAAEVDGRWGPVSARSAELGATITCFLRGAATASDGAGRSWKMRNALDAGRWAAEEARR